MKHAAPAPGAPARTHQGAWRAAACWAVALAAALAGCLRGLLAGADLQIEQLGLLALLAPLLAAPVGARQGWVTAPGWPAYACALVAVAAFWLRGPEGAWA
ncbi:MAG: hypothetical protein KDD82_20400, partial [Planctomycetes bacterium]|nr:hypothetical protein [Planctomycetota bacterium]